MKSDLEECVKINEHLIFINRLTRRRRKKLNEKAAGDPLKYLELYHPHAELNRDLKRMEEYRSEIRRRNYSQRQLKDFMNHYECLIEKLDKTIDNNSAHTSLGIAISAIGIAAFGVQIDIVEDSISTLFLLVMILLTIILAAAMYHSFSFANRKNIDRRKDASLFYKILSEEYESKISAMAAQANGRGPWRDEGEESQF